MMLIKPIVLAVLILAAPLVHAAPAFQSVAGCKEADYVLIEGNAKVAFKGLGYAPRCLTVREGATVTLPGSSIHPLQGMAKIAGVSNPFQTGAGQSNAVAQDLKILGYYGFFCTNHGAPNGSGMAGAVRVIVAKKP